MPNLFEFDRLYRRKIRATGATGQVVRIETKPLTSGKIRVLSHVTVENETTAYDLLRIGIVNLGEVYPLDELTAPGIAELAVCHEDHVMGDGDSFFADLTGTTDDDVLVMVVSGWEMKRK